MITPENQQAFMNWATIWLPRIGLAILIVIIAHFAAKAVKWAIAKGVDRIPFLSRRDSAGGAKSAVDIGERIRALVVGRADLARGKSSCLEIGPVLDTDREALRDTQILARQRGNQS